MSEAVYVRFNESDLNFVKKIAKDEKITRSDAIKKLVSYAAKSLKVEKAISLYNEGKCTIRECADLAELRYFELFNILSQKHLIGTDADNTELLMQRMMRELC
ncbi:hypothetical protein HYV79_04275 [Candidatus Woesearchaeota archaeon]|nr:hypothetical protein [Candidatus Woesearchaeota archaeon]